MNDANVTIVFYLAVNRYTLTLVLKIKEMVEEMKPDVDGLLLVWKRKKIKFEQNPSE